ncbi:kinetochore-associated Ndc80 complex subunit ndc80 [Coemansia javaensis]|uniref:Kinetochore protein NDC80 n=1 Tax=Coemansia javaensis TaxID=2761396 RepID=A0A9W8H7S6_9FUNG|nr:kinetochore-associated Ndc80 complex subunit ndc80 [Coemansia javaensis]
MNIGEGSGIPPPPTLRGPRVSMAPSAFGQGAPPSAMRTARRPDVPGLLGAQTPGRGVPFGGVPPMSYARNAPAARLAAQTPGTSRANRRASVFAGSRRTTMALVAPGTATRGAAGAAVKDPRPIKDRAFQSKAQQRIMNYLSTHAYPGVLTPRTLSTPTVKDFEAIFKFLYAQLDPRFTYVKKFEEEALQVLRGIHYPYVSNISKSHIYSAGSMSTWPGLLAMLLWLVELIECVAQMVPQDSSGGGMGRGADAGDSAQFVDRVFFDYLAQAYPVWLDVGEEPPELEEALARQFEQKNASLIQETADVERRLAEAKAELEALVGGESPLALLEKEHDALTKDKEKCDIYVGKVENTRQRLTDSLADQKQQQDAAQFEQMALEKEKAEVQEIVDAQQISPEDVDRMNTEQSQLLETLEGVQARAKEVAQAVWEHDARLSSLTDDIDTLAQEYAIKAHRLGFVGAGRARAAAAAAEAAAAAGGLPESASADPLGGVDIELAVDAGADDRAQMTSVDLRRDVRPALQRACDVLASRLYATQNAVLELREQMDQLVERRMEQQERVDEMDKQARRHNQTYKEMREAIMAETRAATAKIEALEGEIAAMRQEIKRGELMSKSALAHIEAEHESVQRGCRMRRSEINEDVVSILEDIVQVKTHAEKRLHELLEMVESN